MRDPAGELTDCLELLRLKQRLARQLELVLGLFALGDVAGDLGKADQRAVVVVDRIDHDARAKARSILADPPALGGKAAFAPSRVQGSLRFLRRAVGLLVEGREMASDDFIGA